tara:strand:- start:10710 stop:10862 length:153 start_codon:yes stop_codon:yes gene_type:complete
MFSLFLNQIQQATMQSFDAISGLVPAFDLKREHNSPYGRSGYFVSEKKGV